MRLRARTSTGSAHCRRLPEVELAHELELVRGLILPTPSSEGRPHQHCGWLAARFFKRTGPSHSIPVKYSPCALLPWSISRPPTEHTPRSADLAWLCCGRNTGRAPPHAVGQGSTTPTPRLLGGSFFKRTRPSNSVSMEYGPCALLPWSISRPPTEHTPRSADLACFVVGEWWTRSVPCRQERVDRTNASKGRWRGLRKVIGITFESRAARPARCLSRGIWPDRSRSTR